MARQKKLTATQRRIMERLQGGDWLTHTSGRNPHVYFRGDSRSLNPASVHALHKLGLTDQIKAGAPLTVGLYRVVLTEAGKAWKP